MLVFCKSHIHVTTISTSSLSFCPKKADFLGPWGFFENVKKAFIKAIYEKMALIYDPCLMSHMGLLIEP